jgi:hypothetical protein
MHLLTLGTVKTLSVQNFINRSNLRHYVVIIGLVLATSFLPPRVTLATPIPIPIDLKSDSKTLSSLEADLAAPNVQFQGQTIAMDFSFQNGQFIRLFTATKSFQIDTFLRINNAPLGLNFTGSGFLEDNQGGALGSTITLQAFPVTDLNSQTGVDLLLRPLASNAVPGDAYGFHLDLTLPDSPGFGFGHGPDGDVRFDANIFGIGPPPGIPRDIVPDGGSTALLLAITLGGLISMTTRVPSPDKPVRFRKLHSKPWSYAGR